jgi:glycosyltransferase involved in cell wall biosynthesis
MVASWHTNLHEYASRRLRLPWAGQARLDSTRAWVEQQTLRLLLMFYGIPRVVLAPNRDLAELIERGTGKPTFLMSRGVNTDTFTPARRRGPNAIINIGYVGRLSVEKNVRLLQKADAALDAEGIDVRFTIVGDGGEREWLRQHMLRAEFTGVLHGEALADAYAQMDVFAFPSETDTVGNVVLEAMASGVPPVVMATGGQRFVVDPGATAIVADNTDAFVQGIRTLVENRQRREAMGAAARARALDLLSWDSIFIDICCAYAAAISLAEGGSAELGMSDIVDLLAS